MSAAPYRASTGGGQDGAVLRVAPLDHQWAAEMVVEHHYLHRRPPMSFAFALHAPGSDHHDPAEGVCTFGVPASRHLQMSACPTDPDLVLELNRLWVTDDLPHGTESWFVARCLAALPPRIIVSYADTREGHFGFVYRALSWNYAGWTDMERKTPRFDYIPLDPTKHTRDAFRTGVKEKIRRKPKVKFWTVTGSRLERRRLRLQSGWPALDWTAQPPPGLPAQPETEAAPDLLAAS